MSATTRQPRVSVIIPAYNADRYIAEAINSIFSQSYQDYEIIVVDDGSTDSTPEILQSYGSRIYSISQTCLLYTSPSPRD